MFSNIGDSLGLWFDEGVQAIVQGWLMALLVGCVLQFIRMLVQALRASAGTHEEN